MLQKGVTVSRTADDLVRYHGKMMVIDREELYVFGFNYTAVDLKSRSFGIVTRDRKMVTEALRLFEADAARRVEFEPELDGFVVSPENAREQLATFIKRTKKTLSIYDPRLTDAQMLRLLQQKARAEVDVRVLGKVGKRAGAIRVQKMPGMRLHVRAIELDARREVGLIVKDPKVVKRFQEVFEEDWAKTDLGKKEQKQYQKEIKQAESEEIVLEVPHT
jgi:hypothetical protein